MHHDGFHFSPYSDLGGKLYYRSLSVDCCCTARVWAMTVKSNSCIIPNTYAVSRPNAENETRIRGSVIAAEPKPKRLEMTSRRTANEFIVTILYCMMYIYASMTKLRYPLRRHRRPRRPYNILRIHYTQYIYIYIICI